MNEHEIRTPLTEPTLAVSRPKPWIEPVVAELPTLTHLTLQSGGGGPIGGAVGGSGGSGGLVF